MKKQSANRSDITDYDITKQMLKTIRAVIRENEDGVISPTQDDETYKEEVKKLQQSVDPRMVVSKIKIYPKNRDVELDGRLDTGINFYFSIKAMKPSISITDENGSPVRVYLDGDVVETIKKLFGYYENWSKEWAEKLTNEY